MNLLKPHLKIFGVGLFVVLFLFVIIGIPLGILYLLFEGVGVAIFLVAILAIPLIYAIGSIFTGDNEEFYEKRQ